MTPAALPYEDLLLESLKDPEYAVGYLNEILKGGDVGDFLVGIGDVARVHGGVRALARKAGLNREHLFRMLSPGGNPELRSLSQVVAALGFKLVVEKA